MRSTITIVVLVCSLLLSAAIHRGTRDIPESLPHVAPLESARLSMALARGRLLIRGTMTSAAHELTIRQLAADQLGDIELQTDFYPGLLAAPGWEATSNRLLYVLAAMDSAEAVMNAHSIVIRGVTADAATFGARIEFLREQLPQQIELINDVVFIRSSASFDELCIKAFSGIVFEPVSFAQSSTEIRLPSRVTLDRITDFAHDCPSVTIAITGHTDSSGDETWNQLLSLARAQSVADHIAGNGIEPGRLVVAGLGSSVPIADNSTAHGRELNRRIEFEIR